MNNVIIPKGISVENNILSLKRQGMGTTGGQGFHKYGKRDWK
jgi:hypothetical protein